MTRILDQDCYLQPTYSQVVFLAWIPSEAQHSEGDWSRRQAGQSQLPFAGICLLQECRELQNSDLQRSHEQFLLKPGLLREQSNNTKSLERDTSLHLFTVDEPLWKTLDQ